MNQLFVSLIILLVPGIVATLILDVTMQHKKWNNFIFSVYVVIFGFCSYFTLFIFEQISAFCFRLNFYFQIFDFVAELERTKFVKTIYWEIFYACIIAILLSLTVSYVITHKWLTKFANKYGISYKYGNESLFYYYLNSKGINWITVRDFSKKIIYTGKLQAYSEQNNEHELTMSDVDVYLADSTSYSLANIYICGKFGDLTLEPLTLENAENQGNADGKNS